MEMVRKGAKHVRDMSKGTMNHRRHGLTLKQFAEHSGYKLKVELELVLVTSSLWSWRPRSCTTSSSSKRLANTTTLFGDGLGTSSPSRAESYRLTAAPGIDELMALQRAGQRMLHSLEDPQGSAAKWSPKSWKTPLEQGEDMLLEQGALDERERLVRVVKSKSLPPDPFRSHIALNIKQRMAECATNDSKEGLAINQRCLNIRKQLAGMVNARKELASLRAKIGMGILQVVPPIGATISWCTF
eukprot:s713_g18.t1